MIFIVYTANQEDNEALLNQANDLTYKKYSFSERQRYHKSVFDNKRGNIVTSEQTCRPISRLLANETLYVVGHGNRDAPALSGFDPKELSNLLQGCGLNPRIKHLKIKLICCHSGHKPHVMMPSFAQMFYFELLKVVHPLDLAHREKEGSLFTVKAPKHVIGFRIFDGKAIGLKPEQYAGYQRIKEASQSQLEDWDWLNENASPLSKTDYQIL